MAGWLTSTEQITVCLACSYLISCDQLNMIKSKTKMHRVSVFSREVLRGVCYVDFVNPYCDGLTCSLLFVRVVNSSSL